MSLPVFQHFTPHESPGIAGVHDCCEARLGLKRKDSLGEASTERQREGVHPSKELINKQLLTVGFLSPLSHFKILIAKAVQLLYP